jgi:hypothetical protein
MDIHIEWHEIFEALVRFPVLLVLLGGQIAGTSFVQAVKKTWSAFYQVNSITIERYKVSVMWLSILATYCFSLWLWHGMLGHMGVEEVVCVVNGVASPWVYKAVKALVRTKFPAFAAKWGAGPEEQ